MKSMRGEQTSRKGAASLEKFTSIITTPSIGLEGLGAIISDFTTHNTL